MSYFVEMVRWGARLGGTLFVLGLFLAGPQAVGVASTDGAEGASASSSAAGEAPGSPSGSDEPEPRTAPDGEDDPGTVDDATEDDSNGAAGALDDTEPPAEEAPGPTAVGEPYGEDVSATEEGLPGTESQFIDEAAGEPAEVSPVLEASPVMAALPVVEEFESADSAAEKRAATMLEPPAVPVTDAATAAVTDEVAIARVADSGAGADRPMADLDLAAAPRSAAVAVEQAQSAPPAKVGLGMRPHVNRPLTKVISRLFDAADNWLARLPKSPITSFLEGVMYLVRRTFFDFDETIMIPEIDSATSKFAVRVDPKQQMADAIKIDSGTVLTLTVPRPVSSYTVLANKPDLVEVSQSGNMIQLTAKTPGFLGLAIQAKDGTSDRYVGVYIADPQTHVVPDSVDGYLPVGSLGVADDAGYQFLESFNFRDGVAPIDYLYIYDQGGADYTDGTVKGLLTQALRNGLVPVIVFYNIQNVLNSSGTSTGVIEGPDSAYQAINNYNQPGQTLFTGYMDRYFEKLGTDFATMNSLGVPVQVVMEPDFLGYMQTTAPTFQPATYVPDPNDRTLNTAQTSAIYDAGLLARGVDPEFPDTVGGFVQAVNYYVGHKLPNLRIGWMTNIWSVADQQNWSLGLLHMTDSSTYPWQGKWTGPAPTWAEGRAFIAEQAAGLGAFLDKVGVMSWSGAADRSPFLTIDKYGVDGAYTYDPAMLAVNSGTAAFGDLQVFVDGAYGNLPNVTGADIQKYFGLSLEQFEAFYNTYAPLGYRPVTPEVTAVFTTLQNAVKSDPNLAKWLLNADQWNNYLYLVEGLSKALNGAKVMLWQIPQGHINGSTKLPGTDLTNTDANFEDSAPSYFFGDSFIATDGRLHHFGANQAGDPAVTVSGTTVTWGEHMTLAEQSGVMSVLFGAGLGVSTRGAPTGIGGINDKNFWFDKATAYLISVAG